MLRDYISGSKPRKPRILELGCQFCSHINILQQRLNNYAKRRTITNRLGKIGIAESKGDIISAVKRHLLAKTTSGTILCQ
jgi:hypothetical protein